MFFWVGLFFAATTNQGFIIPLQKNLRDSWIVFHQTFLGLELGTLFPARESFVSDIPAGDGNIAKLFLKCVRRISLKILIAIPKRRVPPGCKAEIRTQDLPCGSKILQFVSIPVIFNKKSQKPDNLSTDYIYPFS